MTTRQLNSGEQYLLFILYLLSIYYLFIGHILQPDYNTENHVHIFSFLPYTLTAILSPNTSNLTDLRKTCTYLINFFQTVTLIKHRFQELSANTILHTH